MYNTQVTLYDDVKVDSKVKEYLFKQAKHQKYQVVLDQLSVSVINNWKTKPKESWCDVINDQWRFFERTWQTPFALSKYKWIKTKS